MSRVLLSLLCRPTSSGSLIILGEYLAKSENATSSSSQSEEISAPSVAEIRQLILQRARLYFTNKDSLNLERLVCHYSVVAEQPFTLVYVCIAEPGLAHAKAALFLDKLQNAVSNDVTLLTCLSDSQDYQFQTRIAPKFAELTMEQNKQGGQSARMSQLQQQVADVKTVMNSNVQRILERGDRLENLEGRTEALTQSSESFKVTARRVQRHMCMQNAKWTILIAIGTAVVVIIIVMMILNSVGVFDKH
ncbi:unnamed protein product [Anisakis simplex]|uniref:Vesicle-associated membrane protein 7 n=1 Tax=Anisakis simplex TaxID=6269 RepID=A0A0M3K1R0_ANISI|nr:unnamed protein product [Anisakis simplex]